MFPEEMSIFHQRPVWFGVRPTNNQAEQSIRFLVIFRKIMFGTRSEKGKSTHSILPSLVLTARRQGAQAALYRNSS
jgi:hypothetical protein